MAMFLSILMCSLLVVHPIIAAAGIFYEEISKTEGSTVTEESMQQTPIIHDSIHECSRKDNCNYVVKNAATGKITLYNSENDLPRERTGRRIWRKIHHDYTACNIKPCQFYERCVYAASRYSCVTLTNVALFKNATQSSTLDEWGIKFSANKAVDGNSRPDLFNEKTCAHTDVENNPRWKVDFGKIYSVTGVEITNRADCCGERLQNFTVTVDDQLCFERLSPIPTGASVKIPCQRALKGRSLTVSLKYYESLTLCEVKVYTTDEDVNECLSNPCQSGQICIDFNNAYVCS